MAGAALSTPELLFYFPAESIASLTRRWQDWVSRGATVATRKDQAQDCPGTRFELLRTHILLRPVMTAAVAIAEPRLDRANSVEDKLVFFPFLPWPWPQMVGAHLIDGDPDTLWLMPRSLTVDDF
ncbi:hypothetical protein A7U43_28115 (plasmid) [Mycobacterium adipatum]|uniref:Uncharacterized protein n=1 Tax=Mycobacterium adipatum TaxID=1682113 RepID=A0A172UWB2_9MYCO|nr:hypothetical protein [Mycobacterium adipatum]ANE83391.1 hypothetical protein A7U43_28115 [Mycobacterium adipatum]HPE12223.1 hypothetical protein [Actinomycetota bacterium]